jgi:hypothetical protein
MTAASTVDHKDDNSVHTFLCCIERNNNKQRSIATKEHKFAPIINQPNLYAASWEQAAIVEQQHCQRDDDTLRCVARGYDNSNDG